MQNAQGYGNTNPATNPGGIPGGSFQYTKTAAEAIAAKNGSTLVPGANYKVTGLKTKGLDPNDESFFESPTSEDFVFTAISNNEFDVRVKSLSFPDDIVEYDLTTQEIKLDLFSYAEYTNQLLDFEINSRIVSFTPTALGFDVQLNGELDYTAFSTLTIYDTATFDTWSFAGAIQTAIDTSQVIVTDNGGFSYSFEITALSDLNNPYDFSFDQMQFSFSGFYLVGQIEGRVTYRKDTVNGNEVDVTGSQYPYDTADFRYAQLIRYSADPSPDFFYPGGYISGSPDNLVIEVTGTWGTVTKTVVVDSGQKQLRPIFNASAKNVKFNKGIFGRNATFGNVVAGYENYGLSLPVGNFLHYSGSVSGFYVGEGCTHYGLYLDSINGTRLYNESEIKGPFFSGPINKGTLDNGKIQDITGIGGQGLNDFSIKDGTFYLQNIEQTIYGLIIKGLTLTTGRLGCSNSRIFGLEFYGNNNYFADYDMVGLNAFSGNKFTFPKYGVTHVQFVANGGDIVGNDLTIIEPTYLISVSYMLGWRGTIKTLGDISINGRTYDDLKFFGGDFVTVSGMEDIYDVEFHGDVDSFVINGGMGGVKFFKKVTDVTLDNAGSIYNTNVFCDLDTRTIATNNDGEDFVGVSSDGKLWKQSYTPSTGVPIQTEVL